MEGTMKGYVGEILEKKVSDVYHVKTYKVWYWKDGIEKIMYEGPHYGRARTSARLWSRTIPNIEANFDYKLKKEEL